MSFHLLLPPEEVTWRMSPEGFTAKIKDRWPDAKVTLNNNPEVPLKWDLPSVDSGIYGSFHQNGITVGIYGSFDGIAQFSCWYRSIVPLDIPLILMDDGYNTIYPLTAETTPEDITSGRIATEPPDEE